MDAGTVNSVSVCRFGIIQYEPMLTVDPDGTLHGLCSQMIPGIASGLNFSYELINSPDGGFGRKLADGNWSGIMGSIQRGEADMFGIPITADYERMEMAHYSPALHTSYLIIVTALKTEIAQNYWGLFATFTMEVWLAVLASIILQVSFCVIVDISLNTAEGKPTNKSKCASEHFWNFLASFFSEGTPKEPERGINKFLVFVWCLSVLTLMNAFTGHFKSQLTIIAEPLQIENIDDLAMESDDLKVMVWESSSFETFVRQSEYPAVKNVKKKMLKNGGLIEIRDYFNWENYEDTVKGKSAFMVESTTFMYFLGLMCSIAPETRVHIAKEPVFPIHCYFPYTKRFTKELGDAIDKRLYQFIETGLKTKWIDDVTDDSDICTSGVDTVSGEKTLGFDDLSAVFVLWLLLICLSFLVFIVELIVHPRVKPPFKTRSPKMGNLAKAK